MSKVYIVICVVICCVLLTFSAWLFSCEGFSEIQLIENDGEYVIYREEKFPREEITSYIVDDNKLFLFFDKTALVNIYHLDGTFQYGIQVCTSPNGIGDMAFCDGKLYILSRKSSIYIFEDDQFREFVAPVMELETLLSYRTLFETEKNHSCDGKLFLLSEDKSCVVVDNAPEAVVKLPQRSALAKNITLFTLLFAALSAHLYIKIGDCKNENA